MRCATRIRARSASCCSRKSAHWTMSVIDDGRGMTLSPELYAQQGYGLNNMRERAGAIGGEFHIESKPGEGTRVVINLPRPHVPSQQTQGPE